MESEEILGSQFSVSLVNLLPNPWKAISYHRIKGRCFLSVEETMFSRIKNTDGFTLVEILMVMIILGILS
jgi:prepilin-type N-terminal cleavage/methylation domain-containing protein